MNPSATARMLSQLWFITIAVLAIAVFYLAKAGGFLQVAVSEAPSLTPIIRTQLRAGAPDTALRLAITNLHVISQTFSRLVVFGLPIIRTQPIGGLVL